MRSERRKESDARTARERRRETAAQIRAKDAQAPGGRTRVGLHLKKQRDVPATKTQQKR